jgi:hypothetical protein
MGRTWWPSTDRAEAVAMASSAIVDACTIGGIHGPTYPKDGKMVTEHHDCRKV